MIHLISLLGIVGNIAFYLMGLSIGQVFWWSLVGAGFIGGIEATVLILTN